jgi:transcriptional regulator with XRE-family HTH domain
MYEQARLQTGLSRETAAFALHIGSRTLYGYEKGLVPVPPEVVVEMSREYGCPELPEDHCAVNCPIGQVTACKLRTMPLPEAAMQFLKEFGDVKRRTDRIIDVTCDGRIDEEELAEFREIWREILELEYAIGNFKRQVIRMLEVPVRAQKNTALKAAAI